MFISNRLAYLELHKTGSQQIRHLLKEYCPDGFQQGGHNRLPAGFDSSDKYIIGSIRNPWDWYVSLWSYGCSSRGGLHKQLTLGEWSFRDDVKLALLRPRQAWQSFQSARHKSLDFWKMVYSDVNNPQLFRQWLTAILDVDKSFELGEKYGFSSLKNIAGFLTFRYFKLYSRSQTQLFLTHFNTVEDLKVFDQQNTLLNFVITNESLETDFVKAITAAGYELTSPQIASICSGAKKNTSKHHSTSYYYDQATSNLVLEKERFVIDKFNYQPLELTIPTELSISGLSN